MQRPKIIISLEDLLAANQPWCFSCKTLCLGNSTSMIVKIFHLSRSSKLCLEIEVCHVNLSRQVVVLIQLPLE